ncbi:hypothetical protein OG308_15795 [Nocardia salmonicida]|uniref:HNH endonuclease n=1 Tax=Nocardia salmonicida TaxID=53431 RepID=A0ABZ1NH96_9NOCA
MGGPRYDANQTDEDRHGLDNLVLMCSNHHAVIDDRANLGTYTVERLVVIKQVHEEAGKSRPADASNPPQAIINGLAISAMTYETGATHNDFRYATFKVGGDGGGPLGGGGGGGILIISGVAKLPEDIAVNLDGGNGKFPGGGGGGGGAVRFEGRGVTPYDVENGLVVRSFATVNNARVVEGLLYVLGGAYPLYSVMKLPATERIAVACTIDLGKIAPDTLFKLEIVCEDPEGAIAIVCTHDVRVNGGTELVRRCSIATDFLVEVQEPGIYNLRLESAGMILAEYPVEFRQYS